MGHAGDAALDRIEALLGELRATDGLTERKRGNFARGSRAFLHFHANPSGVYADVRLDAWERFRVTTRAEQRRFVALVRKALVRKALVGKALRPDH